MFKINEFLAKISTSFIFYFFIIFAIFCFLKIEYIFPMLFVIHMVSGTAQKVFAIMFPYISLTGVINLFCIFLFLFHLLNILENKDYLNHSLLKYFVVYLCFLFFTLVYHWNFLSFFRLGSKVLSFLAIYYFCQISILKFKDFDKIFCYFLAVLFLLFSFLGLCLAFISNFSYDTSRSIKFHFLFFEFPHSFSIFVSVLVPIFYYYIVTKKISKYYYVVVFFTLPVAVYFGGAKIGVIVYMLSLLVTLFYTYRNKPIKYYSVVIGVMFCALIFFVHTSMYQQLREIFSIPLKTYIENTSSYSINSFHTRVKVWVWMYQTLVKHDALLFGMGYSAWRIVYWPRTNFASAQSDYFTTLFDVGVIGLIGFLCFRLLIVYRLLQVSKYNVRAIYLAIGLVCAYFIGGLTESVEGYPSTSWLLPVFLAMGEAWSKNKESVLNND
ncbi:MAG: O-antigen ligase family protein [Candidatus Desulfofervidus auxilii]|nr:O-antigen ligase family protein [Candidatus Desulfofervidus auxilii]